MVFEVDDLTLSESNPTVPMSACLNVTGEFQGGIVELSLVGGESFSNGKPLMKGKIGHSVLLLRRYRTEYTPYLLVL